MNASSHDHGNDEHCDCHAQHIHRGSISGGTALEAAQKLDPILGTEAGSTDNGQQSTNIANKLDPRIDFDADLHGDVAANKPNPRDEGHHSKANNQVRVNTIPHRGTEPLLLAEPRSVPRSSSDDNVHEGSSSKEYSVLSEPSSPATPHKTEFLNLLDPRIDRGSSPQMRSSGS